MQKRGDNAKPIGFIDIRVFQHATENPEKVQTAIKNLLNEELTENLHFQKTTLEGHHGNPITLFTARLTDKKQMPIAVNKIADHLSSIDKEELNREINSHIERGNLFLRLDKQSALIGNAKLTQTDPIHIKIHFKDKTTEEIIEFCKNTGLLP